MHFNSKSVSIKYDQIKLIKYLEIIFKIFAKELVLMFNKIENNYSITVAIR